VSLLQTPVLDLRWDGLAWHVGPGVSVEHELLSGTLSVSIDLGHWMLLRFQPDDARLQSGAIWIPVQRKGLEAQWHALRCAVYSARPETAPTSRVAASARVNPHE
jgi:hypothetical protein